MPSALVSHLFIQRREEVSILNHVYTGVLTRGQRFHAGASQQTPLTVDMFYPILPPVVQVTYRLDFHGDIDASRFRVRHL